MAGCDVNEFAIARDQVHDQPFSIDRHRNDSVSRHTEGISGVWIAGVFHSDGAWQAAHHHAGQGDGVLGSKRDHDLGLGHRDTPMCQQPLAQLNDQMRVVARLIIGSQGVQALAG